MTEEISIKTSIWNKISNNWHICLAIVVLLLIIGAVINLNFFTRYEQKEINQNEIATTQILDKMQAVTGQPTGITPPQESVKETQPLIPIPISTTTEQPLKIQAIPVAAPPLLKTNTLINSEPLMLNNIGNELTLIDILLSAQQYPTALQLLAATDAQLIHLPKAAQDVLHPAIMSDQQRIQSVQSEREQLLGQLQQLQQHINQQLLTTTETPATANKELTTSNLSFKESLKQKWNEAIQVRQVAATPTNTKVPDVYVAVMLQLSLQQAEFSLERGDWASYQSALQSVQMWLSKAAVNWLPNADALAQTINTLVKQPSPFVNANIQATHAAYAQVKQELAP